MSWFTAKDKLSKSQMEELHRARCKGWGYMALPPYPGMSLSQHCKVLTSPAIWGFDVGFIT